MPDLIRALSSPPSVGTKPKLYAITGDRHSGKTTAILNLYHRCQDLQLKVFGLCEVAVFDAAGERLGYDFLTLPLEQGKIGERFAVARKRQLESCTKAPTKAKTPVQMGYTFDDEAFQWAAQCFVDVPKHGIAVIDEMGLLESTQQGLWPLFEALRHQNLAAIVAVVRGDVLKDIERQITAFDGVCEL